MEFLTEYGLFIAKTITLLIALAIAIAIVDNLTCLAAFATGDECSTSAAPVREYDTFLFRVRIEDKLGLFIGP